MCIQDWRLGRLMRTVTYRQTITAPAVVSIPRNPQRVYIAFSTRDQAISIILGTEVDGTMVDFLTLAQSQSSFYVSSRDHGDWPQQAFQISLALGGPEVIRWMEGYLPEEYLHVPLETFDVGYRR